jgi:glycerol-3-phosphate dehydrogenase
LPYTEAEVRWAARFEQARAVEDVLARRLRVLLLDAAASMVIAPRVAEIMAEELERDEQWRAAQVETYTALAKGYMV